MAYKMKGFSGFGNSPAKQKQQKHAVKGDTWSGYGTTNPSALENKKREHKTKPSWVIKAEEKRIMKRLAKTFPSIHPITESKKIDRKYNKNSPAKQEGPIDEKQLPLQKGELKETYVYKGDVISEKIADYEDRAEFARSDAENSKGEEKKKHLANAKKLQHEADILRNRKPKKK